jgi:hypothetical protein
MSKLLLTAPMILLLGAGPVFASNWVATPLGVGAGGTVRVNVGLVSSFERVGCGPAPCRTMWFVDLYVSPSVSGTTYYQFSSPERATTGIELLLIPGVEYSFSGSYAWVDFRPDHLGACAEVDCLGSIPTDTTLFTPAVPVATRHSTWGAIKALYR